MGTLSNLSQQINNLRGSVSAMHTQLGQQREDLWRLKKAKGQLMGDQDEFQQRVNTLQKPELPMTPWKGELADEFQTFRNGDLYLSYEGIATTQLDNALGRLDQEIMIIEQSISDLQGQIASTESSILDLRERKREELRQ